ncbi:putative ABC transport system permease protein [Flagellimonas taeanensis]|jgi:putative ABC transport system permease protein|uniref:ABC transport system permease protein n=1 Tax=Flagellimonas taeanensis TaxID=1005926 RepID=A0A1M6TIY9_9FLAO|nr:ABC transporter permease [Allomuricauda taeanensis]SFB88620.1 putative ABC transport system permease protein [Allomuricauda taeanensis]SHK56894.1 putative ABC transport system permease protein [Allomuricauda taeanensis]
MKFIFDRNTWQEIFGSIGKNKTRTVITIVGVLWGIFIYIALSGAAKGMDNGFEKVFESVSMNSMFVWGQSTSMPYEGFKTGRPMQLKLGDVAKLENRIPEINNIAPRITMGNFGTDPVFTVRGQKSGSYPVNGDYPVYTKIATKKIFDGGRFINDEDIAKARKVCVIGERNVQELFDEDEDPIGEFIRIGDVYFQVVGVHKLSQGVSFDSDAAIFIPFTTFRKLYNTGDNVDYFCIAAFDDVDVVQVEKDVKALLKNIHRVNPEDERAFGSFNLGEMFTRVSGFAKGMTFLSLIVGIATILAGVIGIGNILLISVKERTKELGVRRALGATPREVRSQIILESVFLTMVAGIMGIILGAGVLAIINNLTKDLDFPYTNPTVPIPYVLGALLIMVVLGTLIGLIPAQRAVSIKPIDALREE